MVRLRELEGELEQVDMPFLILHGAEVQLHEHDGNPAPTLG
jgi:hypothetical protein